MHSLDPVVQTGARVQDVRLHIAGHKDQIPSLDPRNSERATCESHFPLPLRPTSLCLPRYPLAPLPPRSPPPSPSSPHTFRPLLILSPLSPRDRPLLSYLFFSFS